MRIAIFPSPKTIDLNIPFFCSNVNKHITMKESDVDEIMKFHTKNKDRVKMLIFKFGDPMDMGNTFFEYILNKMGHDKNYKYVNHLVIETPLIKFLKESSQWTKVVTDKRVTIKAVFSYGEKDNRGAYFKDTDFIKSYNRFVKCCGYKPPIIYYRDGSKYDNAMITLSTEILKTPMETIDVNDIRINLKDTPYDDRFYDNTGRRFISSNCCFDSYKMFSCLLCTEEESDAISKMIMKANTEYSNMIKKREDKLRDLKIKDEENQARAKKISNIEKAKARVKKKVKETDGVNMSTVKGTIYLG